jgi:hypothetical protein
MNSPSALQVAVKRFAAGAGGEALEALDNEVRERDAACPISTG